MKVSFFAAALLGFVGLNNQGAQAVTLNSFDMVDLDDYEQTFSQIEGLLSGTGEGKTLTDAESDEAVILKLAAGGDCEAPKPEVTFEN